ncbi:EcsC family protein [Stenotrophomonas muris]|jgi:uncharacterized protein (DUF697 family)|uniref:EcsC family protein n=1 Tax=Stenotrophomonas muris TaxID=2963283 RepID=UPI0021C86584|nr:EcsC family protein [Stenotrophomonas muris]MCU1179074.1 EcsC family protein [Stenotrophomonas maltophilia]
MNAVVAEASDSRLLKAVESIAISPADAKALVAQYRRQILSRDPTRGQREVAGLVADKIISRYCRMSATTGGATALTGVIPGIGTALAMVGGGLADASISMKLQVDMTMCLAEAYGWDVNGEDARHLAFLIAAGGSLEKLGVEASTRIASNAGVKMVRQYLKGAVLQALKELFKKIGITFTRKALEKAIPFGIGVVIGSGANYALTKYVGNTARSWFEADAALGNKPNEI